MSRSAVILVEVSVLGTKAAWIRLHELSGHTDVLMTEDGVVVAKHPASVHGWELP